LKRIPASWLSPAQYEPGPEATPKAVEDFSLR
jgi:hypothetical protein